MPNIDISIFYNYMQILVIKMLVCYRNPRWDAALSSSEVHPQIANLMEDLENNQHNSIHLQNKVKQCNH